MTSGDRGQNIFLSDRKVDLPCLGHYRRIICLSIQALTAVTHWLSIRLHGLDSFTDVKRLSCGDFTIF